MKVTALLALDQVRDVSTALAGGAPACISVFAGRVADTGRDATPQIAAAVELLRPYPNIELIWASPRELLNIFQADAAGRHIITATNDILNNACVSGKSLSLWQAPPFFPTRVITGEVSTVNGGPGPTAMKLRWI